MIRSSSFKSFKLCGCGITWLPIKGQLGTAIFKRFKYQAGLALHPNIFKIDESTLARVLTLLDTRGTPGGALAFAL